MLALSLTIARGEQRDKIAEHVAGILAELKLDGPHYADTPLRVADMWMEATEFDNDDLLALMKQGFEEPEGKSGLIVQNDIPFIGFCAHHLVPFWGSASVGYLPADRVIGLSKLTRLVRAAGLRRPSTQEEITNTIADVLYSGMKTRGSAVVSTAGHGCMAVRGVHAPQAETTVSVVRGLFRESEKTHAEFLEMTRRRR
jgi:GTP cyclohydrolase I